MQVNGIKNYNKNNSPKQNFGTIKMPISKQHKHEFFEILRKEINEVSDVKYGKTKDGKAFAYLLKYHHKSKNEKDLVKKLSALSDEVTAVTLKEAKSDISRLREENLKQAAKIIYGLPSTKKFMKNA